MSAQLEFFGQPAGVATAPCKPTRLQRAKDAGELGMARAEDRAERHEEGFTERARVFVVEYLRKHASTSGEDITDAMRSAGICPPDDRAFGGVYAYLSRRGMIKCVGFCTRLKGNGTAGGRLWSLA